ncbi:MAG TPA: hypothetical protein VJY33_24855, partial [Isosphaeraceae bacterium]|nr:hypothetical protein [Isosphaeraceae bacterium]
AQLLWSFSWKLLVKSGGYFVRHRITPRNVGPNRRFLRALVAVLPPAVRWGHRPGVLNRARGRLA